MTRDKQNSDKLSRIITLGEINNENSCYVIEYISLINEEDSYIKSKHEPIKLIIVSGGGNVYEGLGIIDSIINSTTPVHTYVYGYAQSMALAIACVGHYRYSSKNATFMYHELSWGVDSTKLVQHEQELTESKRLWNIYDDIIVNNTNIPRKRLDKIKKENKDWYISPTEALKLGIIDNIM